MMQIIMGKNPAFQFYPGDWRRDNQVQMASMETRGVWFEMLCCMWDAPERGELTGTYSQISKLLGCEIEVLQRSLVEIKTLKIGDISGNGFCDMSRDVTKSHNDVTVINRRMVRERKATESARIRKQRQRQSAVSHNDVTPPSSSSSSNKEIYKENVLLLPDEYLKLCKEFGKEIIDSKIEDLDNYAGTNPSRFKKYKDHNRVLRTWLKKDGVNKINFIESAALCSNCGKKPWTNNGLCRECYDMKMKGE